MPSVRFKFELPPEVVQRLQSTLSGKQVNKALFQATKRTGDAVKKIVVESVREHSTISLKAANQAVKSVTPHGDVPVGEIRVSAKPIPMSAFSTRASKKGGVIVRPSDDLASVRMPHAFEAAVRNPSSVGDGHEGIFYRKRMGLGSARRTKHGRPMANARGFVWRLPIKEVFGPSAADLVQVEKVEKEIGQKLGGILEKNVQSQISRFTKGATS